MKSRRSFARSMSTVSGPAEVDTSYERRPVNPSRMAALHRHAGASILDVGCGNGAYITALPPERAIIGIDRRVFPGWQARPGRFAVMDAKELHAVRDQSVDTVLLFEVLEHLPDPLAVLAAVRRICRENVIITVPNTEITPGMDASRLIYYHWIDRTHVNFYDASSLSTILTRAGFTVESTEGINPVSLAPLFAEALRVPRSEPFIRWMLRRRQKETYHMTLLTVATPTPTSVANV